MIVKHQNKILGNKYYKYLERVDEDRYTVKALYSDREVGEVVMEVLFGYNFEFEDIFDEDSFYELFSDLDIVKIEHIEVEDFKKGLGVGTSLMEEAMRIMEGKGYKQFYLNASPMGFTGLDKIGLVNFYKKFGFKVLLDQGGNVIMGITKNS